MTALVWTDDTINLLTEMWLTHSASRIADHFISMGYQATRNAIIGKAHRLKLVKKEVGINLNRPMRVPRISLSAAATPRKTGPSRKRPPPKPVSDAPPISPIKFVPRLVECAPLHLSLLQLTDQACKYECSSQDDPAQFTFCGQPSNGTPYCTHHAEICFDYAKRKSFRRAA